MRSQVMTLLAVGCCLLSAARAAELPPISAESRITDVTVYGDRADVRRVAEGVQLHSGRNVIRIAGLSQQMEPASVRASGSGDGSATIVNVDVRRVVQVQESSSELAMEMEETKLRVRELEARSAGLSAGQEFLDSIRLARSKDGGSLLGLESAGPDVLIATVAFLTDETGKNRLEALEVSGELSRLRNRARAIQQEINSHGETGEFAWDIDVEMAATAATRCDLVVEYTTMGARWSAEYDVVVSDDLESIEIIYAASVSQRTGEDWSDVSLSLSSAQPALGARLPLLSAWWLFAPRTEEAIATQAGVVRLGDNLFVRGGRSKEIKTVVDGMRVSDSFQSIRTIDTKEQSRIRAINTTEAAIRASLSSSGSAAPDLDASGVFAATFDIPNRQDLPSDGRSRRLRITSVELEGEIRHESVPRHGSHVFLVASVRNSSDYPMLAGPSRVRLGGSFLGHGRIHNVAPGQEFDLSLGVDQAVTVERIVVQRQDDQSGSRHEAEVAYEIQVTNHRNVPVTVTLRDQVPVSADKDISVDLRDVEPQLVTKPDGDGLLEWKLEIPSGDRRDAGFRYEVKYPAGRRPRNL